MMKRSCTSLDQASSMAEYSGYENHPEADLFDVLTQTLFAPQANLPEVDQYLTQPPSSSAFDLEPESSTLENPQEAVESVSGVVDELQNGVVGGGSARDKECAEYASHTLLAASHTLRNRSHTLRNRKTLQFFARIHY